MSVITGASVAHQRASVEQIEVAAAGERRRLESLRTHERVEEAFALETCNRVETYVVTDDPAVGSAVLAAELPELPDEAVELLNHEESLRHLLSVAAGLESLVLGEDQILGQVREAYETARGVGTLGETLDEAITKAIHVGERARTETAINEGVVSLGSAAVALLEREHDLEAATALVVGAGEMGRLAAQSMAAAGVDELVVANRTVPHAEHVADGVDVDARAVGLESLAAALASADVAVTATGSPEAIVDADVVARAGETVLVDIAQPRDVAPAAAERDGVELFDMDALEALRSQTRKQRRETAGEVEAMVEAEFERLLEQYKRKRADDVIAAMYEGAEYVKERELETAIAKLEAGGEFTDEQRAVVESLAEALVGQLLAAPTKSLREAAAEDDWTTIHTALELFDPEFGPDQPAPPQSHGPAAPDDAEVPSGFDGRSSDAGADVGPEDDA